MGCLQKDPSLCRREMFHWTMIQWEQSPIKCCRFHWPFRNPPRIAPQNPSNVNSGLKEQPFNYGRLCVNPKKWYHLHPCVGCKMGTPNLRLNQHRDSQHIHPWVQTLPNLPMWASLIPHWQHLGRAHQPKRPRCQRREGHWPPVV